MAEITNHPARPVQAGEAARCVWEKPAGEETREEADGAEAPAGGCPGGRGADEHSIEKPCPLSRQTTASVKPIFSEFILRMKAVGA